MVFYVHALYNFVWSLPDPSSAPIGIVQVKLLAPHVAVFYLLSGMTSKGLSERKTSIVASRSLSLIIIAIASHVLVFPLYAFVFGEFDSFKDMAREFIYPILKGREFVTQVAWFFIALAVARFAAFVFDRNKAAFLLLIAGGSLLVWLSVAAGCRITFGNGAIGPQRSCCS